MGLAVTYRFFSKGMHRRFRAVTVNEKAPGTLRRAGQ